MPARDAGGRMVALLDNCLISGDDVMDDDDDDALLLLVFFVAFFLRCLELLLVLSFRRLANNSML